ncbi:glycosyltransferase [Myxococcota bacterium]
MKLTTGLSKWSSRKKVEVPEKNVIIFDPESAGHRLAYISVFLKYIQQHPLGCRIIFCIPEELKVPVLDAAKQYPSRENDVEVTLLTKPETRACRSKSIVAKSISNWMVMLRYALRYRAGHCHHLQMDIIQLPLALRFFVPKSVSISGILFRPTIHYPSIGCAPRGFKEALRYREKKVLVERMLGHKALQRVFTLDGVFAEYAKAHLKHGHKCMPLPDPCLFPTAAAIDAPRRKEGRTVFLLFGSLARRKGIFATLDALRRVDHEHANKMVVVFAGKLVDGDRTLFLRQFNQVRSSTSATLQLFDRYIDDEELGCLIKSCDVVLAPYQRFVGSSGVLFWAAGAEKPVITQDYGLVGHLTNKYKLGVTTDTTRPEDIASAMTRCVIDSPGNLLRPGSSQLLVAKNTAEAFASTLLNGIADSCSDGHTE